MVKDDYKIIQQKVIKGKQKKVSAGENIKGIHWTRHNEVSDETKEDRSKTQTYCEPKRECEI